MEVKHGSLARKILKSKNKYNVYLSKCFTVIKKKNKKKQQKKTSLGSCVQYPKPREKMHQLKLDWAAL